MPWFDLIYISINYNPARGDDNYCNIDISYNLKNGVSRKCVIRYDKNGDLCFSYNDTNKSLTVDCIYSFLRDMVSEYIK